MPRAASINMDIACRLSCYGRFASGAFEHLARVGVRGVELHTPPPGELETVCTRLRAHGLHATTVQAVLNFERDDVAGQLPPQLAAAERLGARHLLIAPRAGMHPTPAFLDQLRTIAELAASAGVAALLETHPHAAGNADEALATLARVAHPGLCINFDPANIAYYNPGGDPLRELAQLGRAVGGVHLKDGSGQHQHRWFPALGAGTVDFPALFAALDRLGFEGPCTIEIEPPQDGSATLASVEAAVAASVAYLRRIGRLPG